MPRVPLVKLKPDINKGNINKPQSHVGTFAKRIGDVKRGRRQAEDDLIKENTHNDMALENIAPEMDTGNQKHVDDFRLEQVTESFDNLRQVLGGNLNRKERMEMRKLEKRITNVIKQKTTEGVQIDDSPSEETFEFSSEKNTDDENLSCAEIPVGTDGGMFQEITADVHQELDAGELEGAVGGMEDNSCDTDIISFFEKEDNSSPDTNRKVMDWIEMNAQRDEFKINQFSRANTSGELLPRTEVQWGEEESSDSDSDGGWDFETGGMPLLPR